VLSTTHLMIGGAIGAATGNLPLAVAGGIASHHLADMVLHTDPGTFRPEGECERERFSRVEYVAATTDLLVGGALLLAFIYGQPNFWPALAGGLAGITPDLLDNVPFWSRRFRTTAFGRLYHTFHARFHCTAPRSRWVAGLLTQLAFWLVAAWIVRGAALGRAVQAAAKPITASPRVAAPR
jgi:hypothetical protein